MVSVTQLMLLHQFRGTCLWTDMLGPNKSKGASRLKNQDYLGPLLRVLRNKLFSFLLNSL